MEINVQAHISDNGILVDAIVYTFPDGEAPGALTAQDFEVILGDQHLKITALEKNSGLMTLTPDPFFFDGRDLYENGRFSHDDFLVSCSNEVFNFDKKHCNLEVKTLDGFVQNTYTGSNGITLPYWLYLPGENSVPLMVWEHGGGEVLDTSYEGANITKNRGATCWIEDGPTTAVLSVQYPTNYPFGISTQPEILATMQAYNDVKAELIQSLIGKGKIDENRIYISGASSGGGAVLRFLMDYPDLFAAALPICAKDTIVPISEPYGLAFKMVGSLDLEEEVLEGLRQDVRDTLETVDITDVPIWFVHAEMDPVCTRYTSTLVYEVLEEQGATDNRITLYDQATMEAGGAGFLHASWILAFNDQGIIDWLYSQHK